jgi:NAD(P)-dependent dehydrogenase (short-subunit alcohol dehydrogenase family)
MSKWTLADIPSQAGKWAFITGANSGIGFHAARHLAGAGCAVILGCRDAMKCEAARQRIKQEFPTADVTVSFGSSMSVHPLGTQKESHTISQSG